MEPTTFAALGCANPYLAALDGRGYTTPTPVQAACFQPGLEGRDLLVQSRTGSGKTLAFGLPLLHRLAPDLGAQALVLTPTRELAQQVAQELRSVSSALGIAELVGGMSYMPQLRALRQGAPLVVGTPGRVMDHLEKETLDLTGVSMVVLDECDEMLNMGFLEDVERILSRIPGHPQTYLFSATLPGPIASLAKRFLEHPCRIDCPGEVGQHADIAHTACLVAEHQHARALVNLLLLDEPSGALIFTRTKQQAEEVAEALREANLGAEHLHGDLAQGARNRIMSNFKEGRLRYLVATDVAARGIDVEGLPLVVHMGIPTQMENYIHRSGRTGRAGAKGTSLALVGFKESRILLAWSRRASLKVDWRAVPSLEELRDVRLRRLGKRVSETPVSADRESHLALASKLLETTEPSELVAGLLALLDAGSHPGYHVSEPPRGEYRTERPAGGRTWKQREGGFQDRKPYGARQKDEGFRKPEGRFQNKENRYQDRENRFQDREGGFRQRDDRPGARSEGPRRYEDRAQGARKPFAGGKKGTGTGWKKG